MSRESAYDEHISPLVTKIIALCHEHKIPMVASFELDTEEENPDDPLMCTTLLMDTSMVGPIHSHRLKAAAKILRPQEPIMIAETIETDEDGRKHITISRIR